MKTKKGNTKRKRNKETGEIEQKNKTANQQKNLTVFS
jgi:hypothetical protein